SRAPAPPRLRRPARRELRHRRRSRRRRGRCQPPETTGESRRRPRPLGPRARRRLPRRRRGRGRQRRPRRRRQRHARRRQRPGLALARGIALRTIAVAPLYGAHPTFLWAKDASHPPPASLADTLRYYADRAPAAPPTGCSTDTLFELGESLTSTQVVFATEFG